MTTLAPGNAAATISLEALPASASGGNDYIAKYRDFKYQETLFDLFSRQYEIARVDESREGALIQVVDRAQVPERKAKPKKALIAVSAALVAAVFLLMFVFIRSALRNSMSDGKSTAAINKLRLTFRRSLGRG